MVLPDHINDRILNSYRVDPSDENLTVQAVDLVTPGWVSAVVGRSITATYPSSDTEVYTYKLNATVLFVLTVTYTDSTKEVFLSVERTA